MAHSQDGGYPYGTKYGISDDTFMPLNAAAHPGTQPSAPCVPRPPMEPYNFYVGDNRRTPNEAGYNDVQQGKYAVLDLLPSCTEPLKQYYTPPPEIPYGDLNEYKYDPALDCETVRQPSSQPLPEFSRPQPTACNIAVAPRAGPSDPCMTGGQGSCSDVGNFASGDQFLAAKELLPNPEETAKWGEFAPVTGESIMASTLVDPAFLYGRPSSGQIGRSYKTTDIRGAIPVERIQLPFNNSDNIIDTSQSRFEIVHDY